MIYLKIHMRGTKYDHNNKHTSFVLKHEDKATNPFWQKSNLIWLNMP